MSDDMRMLMAQIDDAPGELLGEFIRRIEELGAHNVQIVSTITKKGRPGYLLYVDVAAELEEAVAAVLGAELGIWGYRVLAAEHKHFEIERFTTALSLEIGGATHDFELRAKTVSLEKRFLRVKTEHDDLSAICATLRERGCELPLAVLKSTIESRLSGTGICEKLLVEF